MILSRIHAVVYQNNISIFWLFLRVINGVWKESNRIESNRNDSFSHSNIVYISMHYGIDGEHITNALSFSLKNQFSRFINNKTVIVRTTIGDKILMQKSPTLQLTMIINGIILIIFVETIQREIIYSTKLSTIIN